MNPQLTREAGLPCRRQLRSTSRFGRHAVGVACYAGQMRIGPGEIDVSSRPGGNPKTGGLNRRRRYEPVARLAGGYRRHTAVCQTK
jgi:hypothetical protein